MGKSAITNKYGQIVQQAGSDKRITPTATPTQAPMTAQQQSYFNATGQDPRPKVASTMPSQPTNTPVSTPKNPLTNINSNPLSNAVNNLQMPTTQTQQGFTPMGAEGVNPANQGGGLTDEQKANFSMSLDKAIGEANLAGKIGAIMTMATGGIPIGQGMKGLSNAAADKAVVKGIMEREAINQLAADGKIFLSNPLQKATAEVAAGKLVPKIINGEAVLVNSKTAGLVSSYLGKIVLKSVAPAAVLAAIGAISYTSVFWAPNEKGDALTTLGIAQTNAKNNGDLEGIKEVGLIIDEVLKIDANFPIIGFIKSEKAKYEALRLTNKLNLRQGEKEANERAGIIDPNSATGKAITETKTFTQNMVNNHNMIRDLEIKEREEDQADKAAFQAEQDKIYDDRMHAQKIADNQERANYLDQLEERDRKNREYWTEYERLKALQREEERKYWEDVRKQQDENRPSKLGFGII